MLSKGKHKPNDFKTPRLKAMFGQRYKSNYSMLYDLYDEVEFDGDSAMNLWDLYLFSHMPKEDKTIFWEAIGEIPVSDREIKAFVYTLFEFRVLAHYGLEEEALETFIPEI